jgi:hypothetical protein
VSAPTLTYRQLKDLRPCQENLSKVTRKLGGTRKWGKKAITAVEARTAGVSFDDMVWVASAIAQNDTDVERRLRLWTADCSARVLHIYERYDPTDMRVRNCIIAARKFARSDINTEELAEAWASANEAVTVVARYETSDAAGSGAVDAATAAIWSIDHGEVLFAAKSAARATAWDAVLDVFLDSVMGVSWSAAMDAEEAWQFDQLVLRLSDPEPDDWVLPPLPDQKSQAA